VAKKKLAKKKNAGKYSFRKTKKLLNKHGHKVKSSPRGKVGMKLGKKKKGPAYFGGQSLGSVLVDSVNPGRKLKRSQGTGWMDARRVKIVRRRGQPDRVLIEKPARKRPKK
jgi:hypothetical protein